MSAAASGGAFRELASGAEADTEAALDLPRDERNAATLVGVPSAVKESFAVRGLRQHLGLSRVVLSDRDAAAVTRLRRAGAIVIGTAAMDQLAWTMTGQAPGFPRCETHSPPDAVPRGPGRRSRGCGTRHRAARAGNGLRGIGGVPAAWCGVVGFKPTFGAIQLTGSAPLAPALDTVGIRARHVDDCQLAFSALSPTRPRAAEDGASPRLGIPAGFIAAADCECAVRAAWATALERLTSCKAELNEVGAPPRTTGIGALLAANLALRWGDIVDAEPPERIHPDVRIGVDHGRRLTVSDYLVADDALAAARRQATSMFAEVDLLVMPTVPILASPLKQISCSPARQCAYTTLERVRLTGHLDSVRE